MIDLDTAIDRAELAGANAFMDRVDECPLVVDVLVEAWWRGWITARDWLEPVRH